MGESLTQRRRVGDEGPRDRKPLSGRIKARTIIPPVSDLTSRGSPGYYVPAAAVIRRGQALLGFTGRKASVGGLVSQR